MERQGEKKGGMPNIAMGNHRVRPLPYPRETLMSPSPPPHPPTDPTNHRAPSKHTKNYTFCVKQHSKHSIQVGSNMSHPFCFSFRVAPNLCLKYSSIVNRAVSVPCLTK